MSELFCIHVVMLDESLSLILSLFHTFFVSIYYNM